MKYSFFTFLISLSFLTCKNINRGNVDGGPCAYKSTPYPATVLEVDSIDNGLFNLLLAYQFGDKRDTMWFYQANNNYVSEEEMEKYSIKPGSSCTYIHMQITEGHCNPDVFVFAPEPYVRPEGN